MRSFLLLSSLLVTALAHAQGGGQSPPVSYEAITASPEGTWAEYTTSSKDQPQQKMVMRYALVEKNAKKMALEISGTTPMGPLVMRMEFVPGEAPGTWKVSAASRSMGGSPPENMPVPPDAPVLKKGQEQGNLVGKSTVKTPIGSFDCKEYALTVGPKKLNLWMSDKALPVGLVKQELEGGQVTGILTATGSGATSKMPAKPGAAPGAKPAPAPKK
jgi:hypothetical protein